MPYTMILSDTIFFMFNDAKKRAKSHKRPIILFIAGIVLGTLIPFHEIQAQGETDTLYANGSIIMLNSETGLREPEVNVHFTPIDMAMVIPDTVYHFICDDQGVVDYDNIAVYIDSTTVGIQTYFEENTRIFPRQGSDLNLHLPQAGSGCLYYYNISGQLLKSKKFSGQQVYLNLEDISMGPGVYLLVMENGVMLSGKYMKLDVPAAGPSSPLHEYAYAGMKETPSFEALYWIAWDKEGFVADSEWIVFDEGYNGIETYHISPTPVIIPQYQWLTGIAQKSKAEGYGPLANMTAILYNQTLNQTTQVTTDANGEFAFPQVPVGSVCFVSVGGNGRYALNNIEYTVPSVIENMGDTLAAYFNTIHGIKLSSTTANHIVGHTKNGTMSQTRKYWFDSGVPQSEQTQYSNQIAQLDAMGNGYQHEETLIEDEAHIKIYDGTYNTLITGYGQFETPLGTFQPVTMAKMYLDPGNLGVIGHELYQADAKDQVGWGILGPNPPPGGPTQEDLDIAEFEMNYWTYGVYIDQKTYVNLNYLAEELETKSPQFKSSIGIDF